MIEILSPVGGIPHLIAAVENGADAVYAGAGSFNARLKADNFDIDGLTKHIDYAHKAGVKFYLALNTAVKEREFTEAFGYAVKAAKQGADALIAADFGLISAVKKKLPAFPVHLSTQAGVHNVYGAKVAEALGVSRVILARETRLPDIREIKKNTNLEIEAFVHGALCVSFSGNCYMSAFAGGNSGNRGLCLQPCRKRYTAYGAGRKLNEGYLLSTSDLCLLEDLKTLADAGVTAFKIEGRMRRPEYVAAVTAAYRRAVDGGFKVKEGEIDELKKAYNRGDFTTGYLARTEENYTADLMSVKIASHKGLKVGVIEGVRFCKELKSSVLTVKTRVKFNEGDGFKILRNGAETGSAVFRRGRLLGRGKVMAGDALHITSEGAKMKKQPKVKAGRP